MTPVVGSSNPFSELQELPPALSCVPMDGRHSESDGPDISGRHIGQACDSCRVRKVQTNTHNLAVHHESFVMIRWYLRCWNSKQMSDAIAKLPARHVFPLRGAARRQRDHPNQRSESRSLLGSKFISQDGVSRYYMSIIRLSAIISSEKEVRGVNDRLASLEKTLHTLIANPSSRDDPHVRTLGGDTIRAPSCLGEGHNLPFEGASSFTAHSKQVSQAFTVSSIGTPESLSGDSPSSNGRGRDRVKNTIQRPVEELYELPPMSLVLKLLRVAKTNPGRYFPGFSDLDLSRLTDMCQKVYFPTDDCSTAFGIVVNAGLWKLLRNFDSHDLWEHSIDKQAIESATAICKKSLDEAARCTPLLLEYSYIQIQALYFLTSRPSLALSFVAACLRLCQDAGYHRLSMDKSDPQCQQKIVIFWVAFIMERGLSLNFGRSSTIQDYDITTSRPTIEEAQGNRALFFCSIGVDLAYIQGDVYTQLYSGRTLSEKPDVKAQRAHGLADRIISLRSQLHSVCLFQTSHDTITTDLMGAYDLIFQSHLALVYRAIPSIQGDSPLHFSEECVAASRAAMNGYNAAWKRYQSREDTAWKSVINWTYLFSPFTPFIVLFGTVIVCEDPADLQLMEDSVLTLKSVAQYSSGIAKLYDACDTFLSLAKHYTNQMNRTRQSTNSNVLHAQSVATEESRLYDLQNQDWNALLNDWDLGLGGEDARDMSSFLNSGNFPSWCNPP